MRTADHHEILEAVDAAVGVHLSFQAISVAPQATRKKRAGPGVDAGQDGRAGKEHDVVLDLDATDEQAAVAPRAPPVVLGRGLAVQVADPAVKSAIRIAPLMVWSRTGGLQVMVGRS